ncbi:MAG: hypothetical protein Q7K37_12840 [Dehalococcoidia bacterium]|nr:hypothetical protein [Dehalococcoidia bacterium]
MSVLIFGAASAQVVPLTVTLPAGPVGTVAATVNGVACGTATTSLTAPTVLTLAVGCQTPGAAITLTSNGVAVASSLTVPALGVGALTVATLLPVNPVTITVPAVPGGSGIINAVVGGQVCATAAVSPTSTAVLSLPAACAVPNSVISFTGAGGATLASTLTVPAVGGGTLTLPNLNATAPISVNLPAGTGTLTAYVSGAACGTVVLSGATTVLTLPATCATAGGTLMFLTTAGVQLAAMPTLPLTGGGAVTVSALTPVVTQVSLPAGPAGTITASVNGVVCGTISTTATGTQVLTLLGDCSIPGATINFVTSNGIQLASTVLIPGTISGTLTLPSLAALNPLRVTLPVGSGTVNVMVGANVCATLNLSATVTTTVTLPATCIVPGGVISFTLNGTTAPQTLTTPVSGTGTLVLTQIGVVPTPAATGFDMSAMQDERSGWPMLLLALGTIGGLVVAGSVVRRRSH